MPRVSAFVGIVGVAALAIVVAACGAARPRGRDPDRRACEPGRTVLLGACVVAPPAPTACELGRARDLDRGTCVPARDVRAFARADGVFVADEDLLTCDAGDELLASTELGRVACVRSVHPVPLAAPCPPGEVRERGTCAPLVSGGVVDVVRWAQAAVDALCTALGRTPSALVEGAAGAIAFPIDVVVRIPANDVTQAEVRGRLATLPARTRPAVTEQEVERALEPLADALRRIGGVASATNVVASGECRRSSQRPRARAYETETRE